MIKILANDGIDPIGKKMLEDAGFFVDTNNIPQDELPVKLQNYDAITVRSDLNKDFIKKIQNAYLDAAKDDFASFSKYVHLYWPHPENMAYVSAQDSMYNQLRQIAGNIKDLKLNK